MDNKVLQEYTPFQDLSFWQRIKASYSFAWQNKITIAKFVLPLFIIGITLAWFGVQSYLDIIITYLMLTLFYIHKQEGHLNHITWKKFIEACGYTWNNAWIYGCLFGICIFLPAMIIFIIMFLVMGLYMGIVGLVLLLIPIIIVWLFGLYKSIFYDKKANETFQCIKYAWKMMKGNWLSTIAYFFISNLSLLLVTIVPLFISLIMICFVVSWSTGKLPEDYSNYIEISVMLGVVIIFYITFTLIPITGYIQFEYLHHKYENNQSEDEGLKNYTEDKYEGDALFQMINKED